MNNPIALRKAKIVCNFGLPEFSRVKRLMTLKAWMPITSYDANIMSNILEYIYFLGWIPLFAGPSPSGPAE